MALSFHLTRSVGPLHERRVVHLPRPHLLRDVPRFAGLLVQVLHAAHLGQDLAEAGPRVDAGGRQLVLRPQYEGWLAFTQSVDRRAHPAPPSRPPWHRSHAALRPAARTPD